MLRSASFVIALVALSTLALAQIAEQSTSDTIGPWDIEATYKAEKFDRCTISQKAEDVVARFIRTSDGLELLLESANWKLESGERYPVTMRAGPSVWDTDVAAETSSVSVVLSDKQFIEGLQRGNALKVDGAGATIQIPLDGSRLALKRLEACFEKNTRSAKRNPFVKPQRGP